MNKITWVANYKDGRFLFQYNEDGTENAYKDIERDNIASFSLVRDGGILVRFHFDEGARLVYRRRVQMTQGQEPVVMYMAGWQKTVDGKNAQAIACIFEHNNTVEMISEWRDGFFDAPEFYEFEN